ncbi:PAS domain S-box protein [Desulfatibacillum aliphaticivorans]|uniref:PAS domain S-box protein n=1 Tax=Desulfatibacillum aliphaticivorans TaxID=218208 RepID=UPI000402D542|nr:transporter substrate-binding domain-containing protein [Desulfatibacillum aliphaticivorans]
MQISNPSPKFLQRLAGRLLLAALTFALVWALSGFSLAVSPDGTIKARGDWAYPPYETLKNGKPVGFNIDVLKAVCRIMGYQPEISLGPWREVREDLEKGRIDMITGMFYSPDRDQYVDFSSPHVIVTHGLFVKKGSPIRSMEDIKNARIAVQEGDIMHDYVLSQKLGKQTLTARDQSGVLKLVASGNADCALVPKMQGLYYSRENGLHNLVTVGPPILPRQYCFAVQEGNVNLLAGLNEGLSVLKATGEFEQIHRKWFGMFEPEPASSTIKKYLLWVILPLIFLLLMAYLWTRVLKRQVQIQAHALVASEQRFSGLLDRLNEVVYRMGIPDGKYEYCSQASEQIFGYTPQEILSTPKIIKEIVHPDWIPMFKNEWENLLAGKVPPSYEYKIVDKVGKGRWIYQTNTGVFDEEGNIIAIEGCCTDITERKEAEEKVQKHLTFFKHLTRVEQELSGEQELEEALDKVLGEVLDIFQCDRAWLLYPLDPEAPSIQINWERTRPEYENPEIRRSDIPMTPGMARMFAGYIETKAPGEQYFAPGEMDIDPENRLKVKSLLAVAMFPQTGKPWLFGLHQCSHSREWTDWEKDLFNEIGMRIGEALNSLLLLRDIRQSEEMFRAITEHTSDSISIFSPEMTIKYVSPSTARLSGFDYNRFIGTDYQAFIHPEDRLKFKTVLHRAMQSEGETFTIEEVRLINASGKYVHYQVLVVSLLETPGINGIVVNCRDLTSRQEAEREMTHLRRLLSDIINSMPSALIGVDKAGSITHWNLGAEKFSGIVESEALGKTLNETFSHILTLCDLVQKSQNTGKPHKETNVPVKIQGSQQFLDITIYPLTSEDRGGAVIRLDDVTEQVRIEEMMIQSEKMLSVGGLAAGMAHEINNPLAGMLQNAEVLLNRLSENLPANLKEASNLGLDMDNIKAYMENRGIFTMLNNIRESGQRAAAIVDNMLGFSRKTESLFLAHDLKALVEKALELASSDYDLKRDYDFKKIKIEREFEDDLPPVECEATNIQQVLLNLLKNGAVAMAEKTYSTDQPCFTLRLKKEGDMVRLEVEDNGDGMPEEVRKRVFEPFFTTKGVGQGTGLGLSVSYFIIVEKHRGGMRVESAPGKGTTFIIHLPVTAVRDEFSTQQSPPL